MSTIKKKVVVVIAAICIAGLPMNADAQTQSKVVFNVSKGTITMNGTEYTVEEFKEKFPKEKAQARQPSKQQKSDEPEVEFELLNGICSLDLTGGSPACGFAFYMREQISDFEIGYYTPGSDSQMLVDIEVSRSFDVDKKEDFIDLLNNIFDPGDNLVVEFNYHYGSLQESDVTAYGKTSKKVLPSLYWDGAYLLVPGNFVQKMYVKTKTGNEYNDESDFTIEYTPMPDPLGMFGVGIKENKPATIDIVRVGNTIKAENAKLQLISVVGQIVREADYGQPLMIEDGFNIIKATDREGNVKVFKEVKVLFR